MAICLEVAEYLPEDKSDQFVADLVRIAPVVYFSAAIPYQVGQGTIIVSGRSIGPKNLRCMIMLHVTVYEAEYGKIR